MAAIDAIQIHAANLEFRNLCNSAETPFSLDGRLFRSLEQYLYYRMCGFSFVVQDELLEAVGSTELRRIFNFHTVHGRYVSQIWLDHSDEIVRIGMRAKFTQHLDARRLLISTGGRRLKFTWGYDEIWGCGRWHGGQNKFGRIMEEIRDEILREEHRLITETLLERILLNLTSIEDVNSGIIGEANSADSDDPVPP